MSKKFFRLIAMIVLVFALISIACSNPFSQSSDGGESTPTPTPTSVSFEVGDSGGDAGSDNGPAEDPEIQPEATEISDVACLIGDWQVDNASYLAVLNTAAAAGGQFESVQRVLGTIIEADGTVTNYTDNFSMTLCGPTGCLDIPLEQSGTAEWSVDEDGLLTVTGGQLSTASISGVTGEAVSEGGGAHFTCFGNHLTILLEGFPPLDWYRAE